ncbi:transposable element Tcb2 transposase [Trichonephila clavipes]|nr:transposable element Tcb2 transposase [Trichonephila clavipes]
MPPRRNKEKFQQLTEFEWGRIIGLREGDFSYHAIGARVQRNSSTVCEFGSSGPTRTELLEKLAVNDGRIPLTANHRLLRLQWAQEHRAWQADWHQVAFSDESRCNLWDHDGCICVRRYAGERCLPECIIERHNSLIPRTQFWVRFRIISDPICYELRDNVHPHVEKTVRDFCSAQHMQLLPWPAYSRDTSHIEHLWYLIGRRLPRDLRPAASKDELLLHIQAKWIFLPQADIQNLFDSMPRRIAALIPASLAESGRDVDDTLTEFNAEPSLWEALPEQDLTFDDYVLLDTDIAVWGALSDAEIVALDHNNTESDEDESEELTPVTLSEA